MTDTEDPDTWNIQNICNEFYIQWCALEAQWSALYITWYLGDMCASLSLSLYIYIYIYIYTEIDILQYTSLSLSLSIYIYIYICIYTHIIVGAVEAWVLHFILFVTVFSQLTCLKPWFSRSPPGGGVVVVAPCYGRFALAHLRKIAFSVFFAILL